MDTLFSDLKFGFKLLVKEKAFALTAILTLALAIGANTAMFSVVDSVLLEPLPFEEPNRLVRIFNSYPNAGAARASNGVPDYFDRRAGVEAFEESALYRTGNRTLGGESGAPRRVQGMTVTPSFFRVLRVSAQHGRTFTDQEGELGEEKVVVLGHALHQQLFAGDPSVVGKDLRIDGESHRVVGVMDADFLFVNPEVRLWMPAAFTEEQKADESRHSNSWSMIARLAPGASFAQAQEQIDAINAANLERFPNFRQLLVDAGFHTQVHPFLDDMVRDVRATLYLLWAGVAFVLLIACVNLANLILVRSTTRLKELSTRVALGAGRRRVARQLLTESILLSVIGGILGLGVGQAGLMALRSLGMDTLPRGAEISMDSTALLVTLVLSLVLGVVFGTIPVFRVMRLDLNSVLREEGRGGTGGKGARLLGRALVTAQVAFAFVLLIGAGLLLASFRQVLSGDPGFDVAGVTTAGISLPSSRYTEADDLRTFTDRATAALRALPGVEAVDATDTIPLGGNNNDSVIFPEGYEHQPGQSVVSPGRVVCGPDYFRAMGIDLIRGRSFDLRDGPDAARAIIVDTMLAAHFWGEQDPVGKRMFLPQSAENLTDPGPDPEWLTVIGVVEAVKLKNLEDGGNRFGVYYFPMSQEPRRGMTFALRSPSEPAALMPAVRSVFRELDPELPVFDVQTMEERVAGALTARRSPMLLSLIFGAVALFLAAVGLYGVLAYWVAKRSREMGIRMALGSSAGGIFGLVLREGLWIVGIGLSLGLAGAFAVRELLAKQLYGVEAMDPRVTLQVMGLLAAVSLLACAVPGWKATRIAPAEALHE